MGNTFSTSTKRIITVLHNYYRSKDQLQGLLGEHSQPIADINLSIINSSQMPHFLEAKENKLDAKEDRATEPTALAQYEALHQIKHPIAMADIFDKAHGKEGRLENKPAKRLLVVGAPGVGKTTMSQYIANQWASGKLWPGKFNYVFWLPLRKLLQFQSESQTAASIHIGGNVIAGGNVAIHNLSASPPLLSSPEHLLAGFIHQECLESKEAISLRAIIHILQTQSHRTLLLLDGYDEVAHLMDDIQYPLQNRLLKFALKAEHVILTSRPYQLPKQELIQSYLQLVNTGFTDSNIEDYVTRYFANLKHPQPAQGAALFTFLKANLSIWGTTHIPINLALICEIWQEQFSTTLDEKANSSTTITTTLQSDLSMTGLYQQMTLYLLKRYLEKKGIKTHNQLPIWVYEQCELELLFLSQLAFEGLQTHQIILSKQLQHAMLTRIRNQLPPNSPPFFGKILASGFLRATSSPIQEEIDKPHYFIHLTFQEYLAAFHLVTCLKSEPHTKQHRDAITWLQTEKYNPRYQVTLGFMAGILSLAESSVTNNAALQYFWQTLLSEQLDMVGFGHMCLMIRCLEEAREDGRVPYRPQLLADIGQWLTASCGNQHIQEWLTPLLNTAPWIAKQPTTLTGVLSHFENGTKKARQKAFEVLGRLYVVAAVPAVFSLLKTALDSESDDIRAKAIEVLRQLGPTITTAELLAWLRDQDQNSEVRAKAAEALGRLEPIAVTSEVLAALLEGLEDENREVGAKAADALGQLGLTAATPQVLAALLRAMGNANWRTRQYAAKILDQLGPIVVTSDELLTVLLKGLKNTDSEVNAKAAKIIGQLGPDAAISEVLAALLKMLKNKSLDDSRINAAIALGRLGSPEVMMPLWDALENDKNNLVRARAVEALGRLYSTAPIFIISDMSKIFLKALADEDINVKANAAEALGQSSLTAAASEEVLTALLNALKDDKYPRSDVENKRLVSAKAAAALSNLGPAAATPKVLTTLLSGLEDERDWVRANAAEVLGHLGPTAATPEVLTALLSALGREESWGRTKWIYLLGPNAVTLKIITALGRLGSVTTTPEALTALSEWLRNGEYEVRERAAKALGQFNTVPLAIIPILLLALQDEKNSQVRHSIAASLNQLKINQHIHALDPSLLQAAVYKETIVSTIPLSTFIMIWCDTQNSAWLEIIAYLAFRRTILITWQANSLYIYEDGTATKIALPTDQTAQLIVKMRLAFAKQARVWELPEHFYTALQAGKSPYLFAPTSSNATTTLPTPPSNTIIQGATWHFQTGDTKAGEGNYRAVLTGNYHLISGHTHAQTGDVKEIIVDKDTFLKTMEDLPLEITYRHPDLPQNYAQFNTLAEGDCLFIAVCMQRLLQEVSQPIDSKDYPSSFGNAYRQLFGEGGRTITLKTTKAPTTLAINADTTIAEVYRLLHAYDGKSMSLKYAPGKLLEILFCEIFRNRVVNHMRIHAALFRPTIEGVEDEKAWKNYLTRMAKPGTFGGQPEIRAMRYLLGAPIRVYCLGYKGFFDIEGDAKVETNNRYSAPTLPLCIVHVPATDNDIPTGELLNNHYHYVIDVACLPPQMKSAYDSQHKKFLAGYYSATDTILASSSSSSFQVSTSNTRTITQLGAFPATSSTTTSSPIHPLSSLSSDTNTSTTVPTP